MKKLPLKRQLLLEEENGKTFLNPLYYYYTNFSEEEALQVLPFSVGIEIECDFTDNFNSAVLSRVPYLLDCDCYGEEIRIRLPNGVKGLIALYLSLEYIKMYCLINHESGIHIHVDCTDSNLINTIFDKKQINFILSELDEWETTSTQEREVAFDRKFKWVNVRSVLQTIEYRICNMTFDYIELLTKVNNACWITNKLKKDFDFSYCINYNIKTSINISDLKEYYRYYNINQEGKLNENLLRLEDLRNSLKNNSNIIEEVYIPSIKEMTDVINNRIK